MSAQKSYEECSISIGDIVKVAIHWGWAYTGKRGKVTKIIPTDNCSSGFMVETDFTKEPMDSGWFIKIENQ